MSCRDPSVRGSVVAAPFTLVTWEYTWLYDGSTPTTFFSLAKADPTTSRISPDPAAIITFSGFTPWCLAISSTMPPSGYPYRFAYLNALVMAFITESCGPYGFSLLASFANASYSSIVEGPRRGPGCCESRPTMPWAHSSSSGLRPRTPNVVATPPTKPRRESESFTRMTSLLGRVCHPERSEGSALTVL